MGSTQAALLERTLLALTPRGGDWGWLLLTRGSEEADLQDAMV